MELKPSAAMQIIIFVKIVITPLFSSIGKGLHMACRFFDRDKRIQYHTDQTY